MHKLHVISFQNPYPANYGGVIDVYYKLRALKEAGFYIILHTYIYNRGRAEAELSEVSDEIYYYKRKNGIRSQISFIPYIVQSRNDNSLLDDLLKDDYPILFEGLHTCFFLNHDKLKNRRKIVRMHNIEHEYYRNLALSTGSFLKKIFYSAESIKLKRFEKILNSANAILAISESEAGYFRLKYPDVSTSLLPWFFDRSFSKELPGVGNYILYHGKLSVEENQKAANYVLDNIVSVLPEKHFIIAGAEPSVELQNKAYNIDNVAILPNLSKSDMDSLMTRARSNLLITFKETGVKIKLLNSLCKGAFCIVNKKMSTGSGVDQECIEIGRPHV